MSINLSLLFISPVKDMKMVRRWLKDCEIDEEKKTQELKYYI